MDTNFLSDGSTRAGTVGGTVLVLWVQLTGGEVLRTMVLAAIGATVSFVVSLGLKWMVKKMRREPRRQEDTEGHRGL